MPYILHSVAVQQKQEESEKNGLQRRRERDKGAVNGREN